MPILRINIYKKNVYIIYIMDWLKKKINNSKSQNGERKKSKRK